MTNVVDIVQAIIEGKRKGKRCPEIALDKEIYEVYTGDDMIGELDAMVSCGILRRGTTINNNYYTIIKRK